MMRMACFLLLISFSLSIFSNSAVLPSLSDSLNYEIGYWKKDFLSTDRLEHLLKDVSLLTLGSLGNLTLVYDVGRYVANIVKAQGYFYYLVGPLDTLSIDDTDYYYRVNKSPFITADVYEKFALGLSSSGIMPVFDGRGNVDINLIKSLITRKLTIPTLVEDEAKAEFLRQLGYRTTFIVQIQEGYKFLNGKFIYLSWSRSKIDGENLRRNILTNSIIYISPGEINVKSVFSTKGVVVFSDEDFVIKEAQKVLEKKSGPGRVPW